MVEVVRTPRRAASPWPLLDAPGSSLDRDAARPIRPLPRQPSFAATTGPPRRGSPRAQPLPAVDALPRREGSRRLADVLIHGRTATGAVPTGQLLSPRARPGPRLHPA